MDVGINNGGWKGHELRVIRLVEHPGSVTRDR